MIADREPPDSLTLQRLSRAAWVAALATFLLIVLGGIVRVTGSGLGCGDDWPLCNGRLIPPMNLETFIEYAHRLAAIAVSILVVLVPLLAWKGRHEGERWSLLRRLGLTGVALLGAQVLLGAITVWLELPPTSVVLHLGTAMLLLATLIVTALEAGSARMRSADGFSRMCLLAATWSFLVVLAGGLVANLEAAMACQGFPLCNGEWMPAGDNIRIHIHWGHRLLAYILAGWVAWLVFTVRIRRPSDRAVRKAAWWALALTVAQIAVAAGMVLMSVPAGFRMSHVALGTAVFASLVVLAWLTAHPAADVVAG